MWYNLNIKKLAVLNLPILLRKAPQIFYLFSLVKPLVSIHSSGFNFRADNIYKLNHNSQVCYLRKALNDRFDPLKRRIILMGSHRYKEQYIYTAAEKKPKHLGVLFLRQASDFADNGIDFLVLAPSELLDENNYKMKALIDYYKLASKRYRIEAL